MAAGSQHQQSGQMVAPSLSWERLDRRRLMTAMLTPQSGPCSLQIWSSKERLGALWCVMDKYYIRERLRAPREQIWKGLGSWGEALIWRWGEGRRLSGAA